MTYVDTMKNHLRHRDGRVLPAGAMEILDLIEGVEELVRA
jgi:hypothetical protein